MYLPKVLRSLARGEMYLPKGLRRLAKSILPTSVFLGLKRGLDYPEGGHWNRVVMNRECDAFIDTLDTGHLTCLEISGDNSR